MIDVSRRPEPCFIWPSSCLLSDSLRDALAVLAIIYQV